MADDKQYREAVEKGRRQREKIRKLVEYVDKKRNDFFTNNLTPSGDFS